jgi:hypothetical protein
MNPYQQAVQDEIMRAYDIQSQQAASQAVGAGAFGGDVRLSSRRKLAKPSAGSCRFTGSELYASQQVAEREQARKMQAGQQLGQLGLQQAALGETAQRQALWIFKRNLI